MRGRWWRGLLVGLVWGWSVVVGATELAAPGRVVATQEAVLSSDMNGRITQLHYSEMQPVVEGAVLLVMDCAVLQGELAKASVLRDAAEQKQTVLHSLQALKSVGSLEVALAESEGRMAAVSVDMLERQLSWCELQAPFSGTVHRLLVDRHQYVTAGQPVVELVSLAGLEVELLLPSVWLSWLTAGASFEMELKETGQRHAGQLLRLDSVVDFGSQTVRGRGRLTPPAGVRLLPGMSGTAYFNRTLADGRIRR